MPLNLLFSACRSPLGMSYFMLRGTVPKTIIKSDMQIHNPTALNRFQFHVDEIEPYAFVDSYVDPNIPYLLRGDKNSEGADFSNYEPWVEVKFRKYLLKSLGYLFVEPVLSSPMADNNAELNLKFNSKA